MKDVGSFCISYLKVSNEFLKTYNFLLRSEKYSKMKIRYKWLKKPWVYLLIKWKLFFKFN